MCCPNLTWNWDPAELQQVPNLKENKCLKMFSNISHPIVLGDDRLCSGSSGYIVSC